jgi:WD40 repeat protein
VTATSEPTRTVPPVKEMRSLVHSKYVNAIAFSPRGDLVASGSGRFDRAVEDSGEVTVWETATGKLRATLLGHRFKVSCVQFTPDGKLLASGSNDKTVILWELATGQLKQQHTFDNAVEDLAVSPDGKFVAVVTMDGSVTLWDLADPEHLVALRAPDQVSLFSVDYTPDGKWLGAIGYNGLLHLWEQPSSLKPRYSDLDTGGVDAGASRLRFAPDNKTVALARQNEVRLCGIANGHMSATIRADGPFASMAFTADGKLLASDVFREKTAVVGIWDVASLKEMARAAGHTSLISSIAFSPDGKIMATGSWDQTVRLWDVSTLGR